MLKHLPPCVYWKNGAYWYVKRNKWTRLGATLPDSLAEYARLVEPEAVGGMPALIDRVLAYVKPKLKASTVKQYTVAAGKLKRSLAEFSADQVRPKHVAAIKVELTDTPSAANSTLSFLRTVFRHALEWQLVESNPCVGILRHAEPKRTRYITDDELGRIYQASGPRLRAIVDVLYLTAQRVGDVLKIRRADLTAVGIEFAQEKTGTKLTVPWTSDLRDAVDRAKALFPAISLTLFRGTHGKAPHYGSVRRQWEAACAAAGVVDAHIHDIRAKALTDAKRQGKDATTLAGHSSPRMTERYLRLRESPVAEGPAASNFRHALDK